MTTTAGVKHKERTRMRCPAVTREGAEGDVAVDPIQDLKPFPLSERFCFCFLLFLFMTNSSQPAKSTRRSTNHLSGPRLQTMIPQCRLPLLTAEGRQGAYSTGRPYSQPQDDSGSPACERPLDSAF